jgi:hypothetical protein
MSLTAMHLDSMAPLDEEEPETEFDDTCHESNEISKEEIDIV